MGIFLRLFNRVSGTTTDSVPDGFTEISHMSSGNGKNIVTVSAMNVNGGCVVNTYTRFGGIENVNTSFHPRKKLVKEDSKTGYIV